MKKTVARVAPGPEVPQPTGGRKGRAPPTCMHERQKVRETPQQFVAARVQSYDDHREHDRDGGWFGSRPRCWIVHPLYIDRIVRDHGSWEERLVRACHGGRLRQRKNWAVAPSVRVLKKQGGAGPRGARFPWEPSVSSRWATGRDPRGAVWAGMHPDTTAAVRTTGRGHPPSLFRAKQADRFACFSARASRDPVEQRPVGEARPFRMKKKCPCGPGGDRP